LVIGFVLLLGLLLLLLHDCTCRRSLENGLHGRSLYHCRFLLGLSLLLLLLMFALLFLLFVLLFLLFLILVLLLGHPIVILHFLLQFLLHACLCCSSLENNLGCGSLPHCNFLHFVFLVIGFVLLLGLLLLLLHDCTCRRSLENGLHGRSLYHCRFLLGLSLLLLLLMFALLFLLFVLLFLLFLILVLLLGLPIVLLHFVLQFLGCWFLRDLLRRPLCDR